MAKSIRELKEQKNNLENQAQIYAFWHRLIPVVTCLIGLIAATQDMAAKYHYSERLSGVMTHTPGVTIYYPWQIIVWAFQYWRNEVVGLQILHSIYYLLGFTGAGLILMFILSHGRGLKNKATNLYGTAGYATNKDLKKAGLLAGGGVILGQCDQARVNTSEESGNLVFDLKREDTFISHSGTTNTLIEAGPRTGKLVSCLGPTLLAYTGSVVVHDTKGELWDITGGRRRQFSHLIKFEPLNWNTPQINTLQYVRLTEFAIRDIEAQVGNLNKEDKPGGDNAHFHTNGKILVGAAALHVLTDPTIEKKNWTQVYRFLSDIGDAKSSEEGATFMLNKMLNPHIGHPSIHRYIKEIASQNIMRQDKERSGIVSSAITLLNVYKDPLVENATSTNTFDLGIFFDRDEPHPTSLYIVIPDSDQERLSNLTKMIISYLIQRISEGKTSFSKKRLKHPLQFVLDEARSLGPFPELAQKAALMCSYGMSFIFVFQSRKQVDEMYGKDNAFYDQCRVQCYFGQNDIGTAEILEKRTGKESVNKENVSNSGQKMHLGLGNMTQSGTEVSRSLINADELIRMDKGRILVAVAGYQVYDGWKNVYYKDSRLKHLADLPVPADDKLREECPPIKESSQLMEYKRLMAPKPQNHAEIIAGMTRSEQMEEAEPNPESEVNVLPRKAPERRLASIAVTSKY